MSADRCCLSLNECNPSQSKGIAQEREGGRNPGDCEPEECNPPPHCGDEAFMNVKYEISLPGGLNAAYS
ncbi:hypothetical protein TNCT_592091 [Trichonephila clavata]|uniref:Uncharacterized protein n=1 Tax=Trichonephila clavata TaxID=2740835 RepID=A0A8X6FAX5_TRICU|nr:hypothetical protein TNCT_592091 [Trichonephila clavata]